MASFLNKRRTVTHSINGESLVFRSMSMSLVLKVTQIGKPLTNAISTIVSTWGMPSVKSSKRDFVEGEAVSSVVETSTDIESMSLKMSQNKDAIDQLFSVALNNKALLFEVAKDCLRDQLDINEEQFLDQLDLDTFVQLVDGFWKVNEESFRPLVRRFRKLVPESPPAANEEQSPTPPQES